jgi:anaerobic selenocysteine-containing dehydrogenase
MSADESMPDRREVLKRTAMGAAVAGGLPLLVPDTGAAAQGGVQAGAPAAPHFDFTNQSAALGTDRIVTSACQFCNALCGLKVHLRAGRVIDVRGEPEDPVQAGELCVKANLMPQLVYNRFRLTRPLRRVGGVRGSPDSRFEAVPWSEALEIIARKLLELRDAGAARTVVSRTSGRLPRGTGTLIHRLFTLLGSPNDTDVGPVCNDAGGDALAATFGLGNFTNGYGVDPATGREDLGSARMFLMLGTNQAETHPVTFAHLLRHRARSKAKLVVVDPRRTPTAAQADVWLAPQPHTDLALVLGMLSHIIRRKLHDAAFIRDWVLGFDELARHLDQRGYTPEWAAQVCDVPVARIREVAEDYARARPAAIFCNAGISHQLNAFDTYRALAFLAAVTGNIGVPGGGCNFMHNTWPGDLHLPPLQVQPPESGPALPVGPDWFAESILNSRPYRMRALITMGNPLLASANTRRVRDAFAELEFYAYTGLFMEESAYFADVILPVCSGLELDGVYMRRDDRAVRWQQAAVPRVGQSRPDWEIWIDLAHTLGKLDRRNPAAYWTDAFPAAWRDYRRLWAEFVAHTPGMGGMTADRMSRRTVPLRWPCPTVQHSGVSTLYLDHASWYAAAEALGHAGRKRFLTPSGKVEITTAALDKRLQSAGHTALPTFYTHPEVTGRNATIEYVAELVANPLHPQARTPRVQLGALSTGAVHEQYPLMGMTGRPSVVHFAGMTHWTYTGKQLNGVRLIQLHPQVAMKVGIANGDQVVVESPRGAVRGTALLWEGIRPDTIFVPHTFGPMQRLGEELGVPAYESANVLTDDRYFDNLSGQQAYKCFAGRIRRA